MNDHAATAERPRTLEDLLERDDGPLYELVDGHLEALEVGTWSSYVAGVILRLLNEHCTKHRLGWVLPADTIYAINPVDPDRSRRPDVSFLRFDRLTVEEAQTQAVLRIPPDLAVEVLSQNDTAWKAGPKVREYLTAGVRCVWLVNPADRTVSVYWPDRPGLILRDTDDLAVEDLLPGFSVRVGVFFEPPPGART